MSDYNYGQQPPGGTPPGYPPQPPGSYLPYPPPDQGQQQQPGNGMAIAGMVPSNPSASQSTLPR